MKRLMRFAAPLVCLSAAAAIAPAGGLAPTVHAATTVTGLAGGSAYGAYLSVPAGQAVATVGPLFPTGLGGCPGTGTTSEATGLNTTLSTFGSTGTVDDKVTSSYQPTLITSQASSTVQNVTLLNGLITATAVQSVANSQGTPAGATSTNGSTFANLKVGTSTLGVNVAPNTTLALAGIGRVVLNEQSGPHNGSSTTDISVTAIHVYVTLANNLGLPVGAQILIAHAQSNFVATPSNTAVAANSYALYALGNVGSINAKSGPYAPAGIGCIGGSGSVSLASVSVPNIGSTAAMLDTASGTVTSDGGDASSSSTVHTVSLLGGLITADVVQSSAKAGLHAGVGSAAATTTLTNARIGALAVNATPAPNTTIPLLGFGNVILNHQTVTVSPTRATTTVIAVDVFITTANALGLPVGTHIIVGSSYARVGA